MARSLDLSLPTWESLYDRGLCMHYCMRLHENLFCRSPTTLTVSIHVKRTTCRPLLIRNLAAWNISLRVVRLSKDLFVNKIFVFI